MKVSRFIRLAALAGIVLLNGCTKQNTPQTEILFWAMGSEGEYVGHLLPRFHAENPDIRVKVQTIPWGAAHEKLLTAFAGNSLPDVCQLGNTWIPEFHSIDALVNLDTLVAGSHSIRTTDYFSGIL